MSHFLLSGFQNYVCKAFVKRRAEYLLVQRNYTFLNYMCNSGEQLTSPKSASKSVLV